MNTYARMLRMIRPYMGQVLLSIVFMILFSVMSESIALLSSAIFLPPH